MPFVLKYTSFISYSDQSLTGCHLLSNFCISTDDDGGYSMLSSGITMPPTHSKTHKECQSHFDYIIFDPAHKIHRENRFLCASTRIIQLTWQWGQQQIGASVVPVVLMVLVELLQKWCWIKEIISARLIVWEAPSWESCNAIERVHPYFDPFTTSTRCSYEEERVWIYT